MYVRKTPAVACLGALALGLPGCLERKLEVKTDPPDAVVVVDGRELKRPGHAASAPAPDGQETPAAAPKDEGPAELTFEHYGIRRIVVRHEGYRAEDRLVTLDPPWYQVFPLDFVTDILVPWTIRDVRTEEFTLRKRDDLNAASSNALIDRAREMSVEAEKHP